MIKFIKFLFIRILILWFFTLLWIFRSHLHETRHHFSYWKNIMYTVEIWLLVCVIQFNCTIFLTICTQSHIQNKSIAFNCDIYHIILKSVCLSYYAYDLADDLQLLANIFFVFFIFYLHLYSRTCKRTRKIPGN